MSDTPKAEVRGNGLIGSYLVSFNGHIVMTGLDEQASREYADKLNAEAAKLNVPMQAIVLRETPAPPQETK